MSVAAAFAPTMAWLIACRFVIQTTGRSLESQYVTSDEIRDERAPLTHIQ